MQFVGFDLSNYEICIQHMQILYLMCSGHVANR